MTKLSDIGKEKEFGMARDAIGKETDPVIIILRSHLYSENLLERIIELKLPRGDKIIENTNLSYYQKLILVDSFDFIDDSIISSLRNLNKLRNKCAHELNKTINTHDINKIGSPLGKEFTEIKKDNDLEDVKILQEVIDYIIAFLAATCFFQEHPESAKEEDEET